MSCFDNVYQKKCDYEVKGLPKNLTIDHLQCVDFYNNTDQGHLWWQELQREATFIPRRYVYYLGNFVTSSCFSRNINFYYHYLGIYGSVRVDTDRGYRLSSTVDPDTVYICVLSDIVPQTRNLVSGIRMFLYCLSNYGTGITL